MPSPELNHLPRPPKNRAGWPWDRTTCPPEGPQRQPWPRITVVTPSFNQAAYLEECIRSVLLQGYPNIEYLIIDGGSTDGSIDIVKRYEPWLDRWVSEPDRGPGDAINKGWLQASGEVIAYLNSDDAYLPGTLFAVGQAQLDNPDALGFFGDEICIDSEGFLLRERRLDNGTHDDLLHLRFLAQPATFLSRRAVEMAGGLDVGIKTAFDHELWLRVTRHGPLSRIDRTLALTRWHEATITLTQRGRGGAELARIVNRELDRAPGEMSAEARRQCRFKADRLAMNLNLDYGSALAVVRYGFRAAGWLPAGERLAFVRDFAGRLLHRRGRPQEKIQLKADSVDRQHWSDWCEKRYPSSMAELGGQIVAPDSDEQGN